MDFTLANSTLEAYKIAHLYEKKYFHSEIGSIACLKKLLEGAIEVSHSLSGFLHFQGNSFEQEWIGYPDKKEASKDILDWEQIIPYAYQENAPTLFHYPASMVPDALGQGIPMVHWPIGLKDKQPWGVLVLFRKKTPFLPESLEVIEPIARSMYMVIREEHRKKPSLPPQQSESVFLNWNEYLSFTNDSYLLLNQEGQVLDCSTGIAKLLETPKKGVLLNPLPRFIPEPDRPLFFRHLASRDGVLEINLLLASGKQKMVLATFTKHPDSSLAFLQLKDITVSRHQQQVQARSNSYAQQLLFNLPDGVIMFNPGGIHLDVNPAFETMTGYSAEEIKGTTPAYPYWPGKYQRDWERVHEYTLDNNFGEYELNLQKKDGSIFPALVRTATLLDEEGQTVIYYATVKDITQQQLVLEQVKENEYRFRQLVLNSPLAIIIHVDGIIRFCNPAAVHLFQGNRISQILGQSFPSYLLDPDHDRDVRWGNLTPKDTTQVVEEQLLALNNETIEVEITSHQVAFEGKEAHQAIIRDISEEKRALQALKQSEEQHRFLVESVPHVIWTASQPGHIQMCNASGLQFLGTTMQGILSQGWLPFVHPEDQQRLITLWDDAQMSHQSYRIKYRLGNPDQDSYRWFQEEAAPMIGPSGEVVRWYGIATDMHEQVLAQNALSKREAFLHSLVQSQTTFLVRLNDRAQFQFANEAFRTQYRYLGQLLGQSYTDLVLPAHLEEVEQMITYCLANPGTPYSLILQQCHEEGNSIWTSWEFVGLRNESGEVMEIQGVGNDISQQKAAEASTEEQRKKLINITNSVPGVVYQFRRLPNGEYTYDFVSDGIYELFLLPNDEDVTFPSLFSSLPDSQRQEIRELKEESAKKNTPWQYEFSIQRRNGEHRWVLNQAIPEPPLEDGSIRWNGILTDITEQKSLKALLDDTSRIASVGGWEISLPSKRLQWTDEVYRIHDLVPGVSITYTDSLEFFDPKYRPTLELALDQAMSVGSPFDLTARLMTANDKPLWVRVQGRGIEENGKIIRLTGTLQDVSRSHETELRLRESEALLSTSLEHSMVSNVLLNLDCHILYIDARTKELISYLTGTTPEVGDWFPQFLPRNEITQFEKHFLSSQQGDTIHSETEVSYPSQAPFWLELVYRPVVQARNKKVNAIVFSFLDITNRKHAEQEVEKLALVAENTDNLVIILNDQGYIEWANDAFLQRSGYTLQEVTGHQPGLFMFGSKTDQQVVRVIEEAILQQQKLKTELRQFTKHGKPYWAELEMEPVFDEKGKVKHFILLENDITERIAAEKAMKEQNEELLKTNQELDTFVYRVSHDLRAPLVSSLGLIDLSLTEDDPTTIKHYLQLQQKSLKKLDNFIQDILNYSRNSRLEVNPEMIDFQELVNGIFQQLNYIESYKNITRKIDISHQGSFHSDQRRLHIVLSNLVSNALKFSRPHLPDAFVRVQVTGDTEWVEILVQDNGMGIPKEHLENIFKMFYRATDRQTGSGLGLYIVQETIQKLGGAVEVDSTINKGTTFKILLPNLIKA